MTMARLSGVALAWRSKRVAMVSCVLSLAATDRWNSIRAWFKAAPQHIGSSGAASRERDADSADANVNVALRARHAERFHGLALISRAAFAHGDANKISS